MGLKIGFAFCNSALDDPILPIDLGLTLVFGPLRQLVALDGVIAGSLQVPEQSRFRSFSSITRRIELVFDSTLIALEQSVIVDGVQDALLFVET